MSIRTHGGPLAFLDRRTVRRLLGMAPPARARRLRYLVWRPNGELAYHEALVRFDCARADYLQWRDDRGLARFADTGFDRHLPIDWAPAPEIDRPDWWHPSATTPPEAGAATVGVYGSIVAKWEDGHVYVLVEDTGHRNAPDRGEGTP